MTVFICKEELDDIWCGIYDAWMSGLGHENVRLEPEGCDSTLFCEYKDVIRDSDKARKVTDRIRNILKEDGYEFVFKTALSKDRYRADKIYRFLIVAFRLGPKVMDMLQIPAVFEAFQMYRNLGFEYQHMLGFTRFSRTKDGVLLGKIGPQNDLTILLAVHFADRLSGENWILYDCNRKKAAVYEANHGWVLVNASDEEWQHRMGRATDEAEYEDLWRAFHQSIAILERTNARCQRTMLPLRFRPYMLEFQPPSA